MTERTQNTPIEQNRAVLPAEDEAAASRSQAVWNNYGEDIARLGRRTGQDAIAGLQAGDGQTSIVGYNAIVGTLAINFSPDSQNRTKELDSSLTALDGQEGFRRRDETPEQRIQYLEQTYNVRIARDGETVPGPTVNPITARTPSMHELTGLEAALRQSQPSNQNPENQPLNIIFGVGRQPGDGARWGNNIYIFPDNSPQRPATIEEAQAMQDAQGLPYLPSSIQHIAMHELAHRAQETIGNDDAAVAALAADLGFDMRVRGGFWNPREFQMHGRDGFRYELSRGWGSERPEWIRRNTNGDYVDAKGNVVPYPQAERISSAEMRERALVKPITNYFDNPLEMLAESTYFFRGNERSRLELLHRSPDLYHVTRANDQREIDLIHGTKNGNSLMIRMPNGRLALNTSENRLAIAEFEAQRPRYR